MCLAIPQKILSLKNKQAITKQGETLNISLVPVITGDWVFAQNGFVIKKISKKQAQSILNLISKNF